MHLKCDLMMPRFARSCVCGSAETKKAANIVKKKGRDWTRHGLIPSSRRRDSFGIPKSARL